jgi:hypothetical protein
VRQPPWRPKLKFISSAGVADPEVSKRYHAHRNSCFSPHPIARMTNSVSDLRSLPLADQPRRGRSRSGQRCLSSAFSLMVDISRGPPIEVGKRSQSPFPDQSLGCLFLESRLRVGPIARLRANIQATIAAHAKTIVSLGRTAARRSGIKRMTLRHRATAKSNQRAQLPTASNGRVRIPLSSERVSPALHSDHGHPGAISTMLLPEL